MELYSFAGLVTIDIGKPFCSTATCIFVSIIFLEPSNQLSHHIHFLAGIDEEST